MDDATRQRLQRDGFGAFSVYYSAARASANTVPAMDIGDPLASRRRRTWGNVATAAAAVVVVERPTGNLLSPVESGTGTVTTSSVVSRSPRGSTSALPSVRYHNGSVIVDADTEPRHIRFMASDAEVCDGHARRQRLLGDQLAVPNAACGRADGSSLIELEASTIRVWPESAHVEP